MKQFGIVMLCIMGLSGSALATERHALKEQLSCNACHYNPSGGGALNIRGRYYQRHDFSLRGFKNYLASLKATLKKRKKAGAFSGIITTALDRLSLQGSVRSQFTYTMERVSNVNRENFDLLDAMLSMGLKVHDKLNIIYTLELNNLHGSDVFIKAEGPFNTYLQVGRFTTPFGLNSDDPTIMVRSIYGLQYYLKDIGAVLGLQRGAFFLNGSVMNGFRSFSPASVAGIASSGGVNAIGDPHRGLALTANMGYQMKNFLFGSSILFERTGNIGSGTSSLDTLVALYASLSLYDRLHFSGEVDFGFDKGMGTGARFGARADSSPTPVLSATASLVEPFYGKISPSFGNRSFGAFAKVTYDIFPNEWDLSLQYDMLTGNITFIGDAPIRITLASKFWLWKNFSIEPQAKFNITPGGSVKNAPASQLETARARNKHQFLVYARASF